MRRCPWVGGLMGIQRRLLAQLQAEAVSGDAPPPPSWGLEMREALDKRPFDPAKGSK